MIVLKNPFSAIKRDYLNLFDDSKTVENRKLFARNIVSTIVEDIYFGKKEIVNFYDGVNSRNDRHEKTKKPIYKNSFRGKVLFLCDKGFIDEGLRSEYLFINNEAGLHSEAHTRFKYGEKRLLHVIKAFVNQILESLLDRFEESKDYLIPMQVIAAHDYQFHKRIINRIETFWNIRHNASWFTKYKTTLSNILVIFLSLLGSSYGVALCIIGIYNTRKLVFNRQLKRSRNLLHYTFLVINLLWIGIYLHAKLDQEITYGSFEQHSFEDIEGSLALTYVLDTLLQKEINLGYLKKNESEQIDIYHAYRNVGAAELKFAKASLKIHREYDHILFESKLKSSDASFDLLDSVYIDIKEPYHVQFMEGDITSPYKPDCKGYGYNKILGKNYFKELKGLWGEMDIGTYIPQSIDTYQNGYCSSGVIRATFKITKL
ncbi:hypothetical protein [uncultured Lacinutrix sp.]|uniref:hypothetical protein n=1 Tax=uncultured Lacinutrix sp. TaxID=574032 RepID=UPI00261FE333|nr:hypothetical protein [uncultured Lacinutrix sp.]